MLKTSTRSFTRSAVTVMTPRASDSEATRRVLSVAVNSARCLDYPCVICGVHFNTARLRRKGESLANAWDVYPDHSRVSIDTSEGYANSQNPGKSLYQIVDDRIVGEWHESGFLIGKYLHGEGIEDNSACDHAGCDESEGDHASGGLGCAFRPEDEYFKGATYNGWRIGAEEMRMMNLAKVIVRPNIANRWEIGDPDTLFGKQSNEVAAATGYAWRREVDDDEHEPTSKYKLVLTGMSMDTPWENSVENVPPRHGIGGFLFISDTRRFGSPIDGILVHQPCYQILKRVAKKRFPKLNVLDGIWARWMQDELGRNDDMLRHGVDAYWNHIRSWDRIAGTEYLAADPYNVPKLRDLIKMCTISDESVSDEGNCTEAAPHNSVTAQVTASRDPFYELPVEMACQLAESLDVSDVLNLRSSSRAWRQLPQSFYRDLVLKEMPWLWEADDLAKDGYNLSWCKLWQRCSRADGGHGRAVEVLPNSDSEVGYDVVPSEGAEAAAKAHWPLVTFASLSNDDGQRINGLVNRKRIWRIAEEFVPKMHEALSSGDLKWTEWMERYVR